MPESFSIYMWIKTTSISDRFPAIATDKVWDDGDICDYTARNNYGRSLNSGLLHGWALALQPSGAWAWNLGDGEDRIDYQPTVGRQRINDGGWHLLAFAVDVSEDMAILFYDGLQVAIYSLSGLKFRGRGAVRLGDWVDFSEGPYEVAEVLTQKKVSEIYEKRQGKRPVSYQQFDKESLLNVMAWNIWNGGREDGIDIGVRRVVDVIRDSGADIVAMQETYGSGPRIADALGYHLYLRSSNLSVISRYPVLEQHNIYRPFNLGGVRLKLNSQLHLDIFSLWLHYLPDFCSDVQQEDATAARLEEAEWSTRANELREILEEMAPHFKSENPLIVAGDFNCPSHLDWIDSARHLHRDLTVSWPVSVQMKDAGFVDAFREVHPNVLDASGYTWSPRSPKSWQDRIDYVYYRGCQLRCTDAEVLNYHYEKWPSDHAAVFAAMRFNK